MQEFLRIADANFNRAREGLRVVEEVLRFVLANAELTKQVKTLRHRLSALETSFPGGGCNLLWARDVAADPGALTPEKRPRQDAWDLAAAGWKRTQEALRVLEEISRKLKPEMAQEFKSLRFEAYTIEKECTNYCGPVYRRTFFSGARLYLVLGRKNTEGRDIETVVEAAVRGGVGAIQLREKDTTAAELLTVARKIKAITRQSGAIFIVNDRVDIAAAADADGVHLGQEDLPIAEARNVLGPGKIIGISTHSTEQARVAEKNGADYIGVGPVFATPTKPEALAQGLSLVAAISDSVRLPCVAIGGIDESNVRQVLDAGAQRIAVVRAISGAPDVEKAASVLYQEIQKSWEEKV